MTTRPVSSLSAIALDATRVHDAARADAHNAAFAARVSKRELATYAANIAALTAGDGASSTTLHLQVAAGAHVADARARLLALLQDVRDDIKIAYPNDSIAQHAFGVGANVSASSTTQVRHLAEEVLSAAHASPAQAKAVGLDAHGIHTLEDLIHALDGTDLAHVHAATGRHSATTATDSIAHLVSAETAHLRLVARRVFRGDEAKLAAYARTLPRHEVVPRRKAGATAPGAAT